ncbi:MAG: peptidylprolyl isomerase [Pirellulales bacterium]
MPRLSFPVLVGLAALAGALLARPSLVPRALSEFERSWRLLRSTAQAAGLGTDPFLVGQPPYTPDQPTSASRPASWPGGPEAPDPKSAPAPAPFGPPPPPQVSVNRVSPPLPGMLAVPALQQENQPLAELQAVEGAEVLARVGPEVILAADVMPAIDTMIKMSLEQSKQQVPAEMIAQQRRALAQQFVAQLVVQKMVYADCRRTVNEKALPKIDESLRKNFEEKELPRMLEQAQATSRADLEQKLRAQGSSIERMRRASMERNMAGQWLFDQTKDEREITYLDLVDYYEKHKQTFAVQAKARWQQITVSFAKHPAKAEAWAILADVGRRLQQGAPFEELARQHSESVYAEKGGQHDWTTKGSLVSATLDEALFQLPIGALSRILEDRDGFHIIRVQERTEAGYTPFSMAQDEMRDAIKKERQEAKREEFLAGLRKKYPVRTIFDEAPGEVSQRPGETLR